MASLLKLLFAGFAADTIRGFVAKLFGFVTFVYISGELIDYLISQVFDLLAGFQYLNVIALAGIPRALGIIAGAIAFRAAIGAVGVRTK